MIFIVPRLRQLKLRPGRDKCAPPIEFNGEIITRCEVEWVKYRMDTHWYSPHWVAYNFSNSKSDRFANAFLYQPTLKSLVYPKMGK